MPGTMRQDRAGRGGSRTPRVAAASATVVLARERNAAVEVLLVKRHGGAAFGASHVFPGGLVEAQDRAVHGRCAGRSAQEAARCLGLREGALDYYSAAVRELFEETGILLARDATGRLPSHPGDGDREPFAEARRALLAGSLAWPAFLERHDLRPALELLTYFAWWVTPVARPARFSTRFFLAMQPPGQVARHDGRELVDSCWMTAPEALAARRRGDLSLPPPTVATLADLAAFGRLAEIREWAARRAAAGVPRILPVIETRDGRERIILPGEAGYPEAAGDPGEDQ